MSSEDAWGQEKKNHQGAEPIQTQELVGVLTDGPIGKQFSQCGPRTWIISPHRSSRTKHRETNYEKCREDGLYKNNKPPDQTIEQMQ